MTDLKDREWKAFFIGQLFMVKRPKARSEKVYKDGKTPFVASGNVNNGVIRCCELHINEILDKGDCITVSPVDGSAFYQQSDFLGRGGAGSSILMLYSSEINRYSGLFIARMIRQTCSKYCYGKMGNQDSIKREKILLPITADGTPDYTFMEQYIKERERQLIQKYKDYISDNAQTGEGGGTLTLENREWKVFAVKDLFEIKSGKDINLNQNYGSIPYVNSSGLNNGTTCFVKNYKIIVSNCITIARTGTVGATFYQKGKVAISGNIRALFLKNKILNTHLAQFLIGALKTSIDGNYNYGKILGTERISKLSIFLPSMADGTPDYDFMEGYAKMIMLQKYQQYLNYINV